MEIYRGDYWFACFRVCSHSVLDKINNENRQTRCIVYGQQVQINYRSIFSGVKSITRKRNFHICKHIEANTFAAIRLDCTLDTFYYTITLASWICLLWAFCEKSCTMWYLASFLLVTCIELTKLLQCRAKPTVRNENKQKLVCALGVWQELIIYMLLGVWVMCELRVSDLAVYFPPLKNCEQRERHLSELDNRAAERQNKQNDMHVQRWLNSPDASSQSVQKIRYNTWKSFGFFATHTAASDD